MAKYKAGFRFCPTDEELIHYLYLKNKGAAVEIQETTRPLIYARMSNGLGILPVEEEKRKDDKGNEKMVKGVMQVSPPRKLLDCIEYNEEDEECLLPPVEADPLKLCFHEYDLYGQSEPWEIWDMFEGDTLLKHGYDLLIFTQLKKKNPNSTRFIRKVGCGVWNEKVPSREIVGSRTGKFIGSKRTMRYKNSKSTVENPPHHTEGWLLDEYTLESGTGKYALCRLRQRDTMSRKENPPTAIALIAATSTESNQDPATSEGSDQSLATTEEAQSLAATEENEQNPATAEKAEDEADSSPAGERHVTAAREVPMNMKKHKEVKLFGVVIGYIPSEGKGNDLLMICVVVPETKREVVQDS